MSEKKYIAVAIPYVNAKPHLGHMLEFFYADVLARYYRSRGYDVKFVCGTDEHGQKNVRIAEEKGITPQEHVDRMSQVYRDFFKLLNFSIDDFIRTSEQRHEISTQAFWKKIMESGDIEKGEYEGLYCVGCEAFKTEKDLVDGKCPDHQKEPEQIQEENYFFRLSRYQDRLLQFYEENPDFVIPKSKYNEMKELVKRGLEDLSISREKEKLSWGVPVPDDEDQVMYVWFEAVQYYLTAAEYARNDEEFKQWWPVDMHIIGKDINRFHSVIWPAMLMAAGIELPKHVGVHGFVNVSGQKMSKTLGNVVDPVELIDRFGLEPVRYFFMREIAFYHDGDYSDERFLERYSADLANGLGNLTSRVTNMIEKFGNGSVEAIPRDKKFGSKEKEAYNQAMEKLQFEKALEQIWNIIDDSNEYIEQQKPWELAKNDSQQLQTVLQHLLYALQIVQDQLIPFMPETAEKIRAAIEAESVTKIEPLFPRLEDV